MAHYAYLDDDNIVTSVIVGKDEGEDGVDWEEYYQAKRTSYNTRAGEHPSGNPFRYNFAGIGFSFDANFGTDGAFIPPKPLPSWVLNLSTALWEPPIPVPDDDGDWIWNEENGSWEIAQVEEPAP